ncbi:hypothetical protein APHAL10511_005261 [Amanita phalloides]|nr:hypothetical protein APHAL10511_005261 [Amanita phalloides]
MIQANPELLRNVIKTLLKSRDTGLDYNKALGNVTVFYKSALGGSSASEVQILTKVREAARKTGSADGDHAPV